MLSSMNLRDFFVVAVAVIASVCINLFFGLKTETDVWKETAIDNLSKIELYKSAEKQNMQIVNNMLAELKNVKNDTVVSILKRYGAN